MTKYLHGVNNYYNAVNFLKDQKFKVIKQQFTEVWIWEFNTNSQGFNNNSYMGVNFDLMWGRIKSKSDPITK